jgi:hypothetical protein
MDDLKKLEERINKLEKENTKLKISVSNNGMKYPYYDGTVTWVSKGHWYWGDCR